MFFDFLFSLTVLVCLYTATSARYRLTLFLLSTFIYVKVKR